MKLKGSVKYEDKVCDIKPLERELDVTGGQSGISSTEIDFSLLGSTRTPGDRTKIVLSAPIHFVTLGPISILFLMEE